MANPTADFPTAIHTGTDVSAFSGNTTGSTTPTHTDLEGKQEEELVAVQTKLGTGASVPASGTYLKGTGAGISEHADFDTDVSANSDVTANTSSRHDAVTVTDSTEIDLTLIGQDLTASIKLDSIDDTKLATTVVDSLNKADSAVQPTDTDYVDLTDGGETSIHTHSGTNISLDTTNFDNNLSALDNTVQKAMETVDELSTGGGGGGDEMILSFPIVASIADFQTSQGSYIQGNGSQTVNANGLALTNATDTAQAANIIEMHSGRMDSNQMDIFTADNSIAFSLVALNGTTPINSESQTGVIVTDGTATTSIYRIDQIRAGGYGGYYGIVRVRNASTAESWYFITGDGTTEESTDITSTVSLYGRGQYYIKYTTNTQVDLYYNGSSTPTASHSTNIPTSGGTIVSHKNIHIFNDTVGTSNVTSAKFLGVRTLCFKFSNIQ